MRAEQVQVRNHAYHGLQYILTIIDEVGDPEFPTMHGFVRPFHAEANIQRLDAGSLEEPMIVEPLQRPLLNAPAAL